MAQAPDADRRRQASRARVRAARLDRPFRAANVGDLRIVQGIGIETGSRIAEDAAAETSEAKLALIVMITALAVRIGTAAALISEVAVARPSLTAAASANATTASATE